MTAWLVQYASREIYDLLCALKEFSYFERKVVSFQSYSAHKVVLFQG